MDEARQIIRGVLEKHATKSRAIMKDMVAQEILVELNRAGLLKGPPVTVTDIAGVAQMLSIREGE